MAPRARAARHAARAAAPALPVSVSLAMALPLSLALAAAPAWAGVERTADRALRRAVEHRLAAEPDLAGTAPEIDVMARDGSVVLAGRVLLLRHARLAEERAWETPGVHPVENALRVDPVLPPPDPLLEQRIRAHVKGWERAAPMDFRVAVRAGAVRVEGTFRQPEDVEHLRDRVSRMEGVRAIHLSIRLTG